MGRGGINLYNYNIVYIVYIVSDQKYIGIKPLIFSVW